LFGSAALGDFDARCSDVDVQAVRGAEAIALAGKDSVAIASRICSGNNSPLML
jgi:hypothetical protein